MKMKNGYLFHCVNETYFSVNVDTKIANVLHVFEIINHDGHVTIRTNMHIRVHYPSRDNGKLRFYLSCDKIVGNVTEV